MVGKKNIRSYEVSIWTLQDSFITVLKPLNLEHKGAIQNGKITLQDDGENRISFSIPMYIREKGEFVENPLWYNTEDGNLIANLRKLKVIFNKTTTDERIFEFIITKVTEKHEGFEKTCEVEGESLAFNELGKQGYKISLSEKDLYNEVSDKLDALKATDSAEEISVKNNINYWIDKVLAGTNWNYSIQMDWSIVDGVIDQYEEGATRYSDLTEEQRATLNSNRESKRLRRHDCVYEDAYVSSWSISNNALIPAAVVESTEKLRMVEGNESNRYNLLQSIAETFEVYTKYKYYYDNNYHIVDREVIFYNNFLDEDNTIDLTYDYDTQSISRELDATDIVTKMYVKTLDDESYPSGLASIADTNANKTGEDYILNFDYLYDIKTINDEQHAAIKIFEKDIANLNKQIKPLDTSIIKLESKLLDAEIARDNALATMKEAEENINFITEQLKAITEDSNYSAVVSVVKENPAFIFLSKNNSNYLGKFGSQFSGIIPGTVKVYSDSTCTTAVSFSQQIKNNMVQSLIFSNAVGSNASNGYLYTTFNYKPALEKEKLREDYQTLYNKNKKIYETNLTKVSQLEDLIKTKKTTRENLYNNKTKLISDFENMMGPALREGNWQPEDEYVGYGDQYDEDLQPSYSSSAISTTSGKLKFIWDKELFDEEEKNYYEYGINQEKVYYPCINLTAINSNIFDKLKEEDFRNGLSFVYKNPNETNPYLLPQGTNCKFAFIQPTSGGNIIPVLMITNLYNETNITNDTTASTALAYLRSLTSYIVYTTDISILLNTITANNSTIFSVPSSAWVTQPHKYNIVYPRLEIQSDLLKTGTNELLLHIYREKSTIAGNVYAYIKLEEFVDYSLFLRDEKKYITIKPEVLLAGKIGEAKIKINYCLANTALQIYLDAIEVMKENAYPKVSYTINQLFSPKLFYNTYDRLGQLAHINDAKLKFKNVMGYISAVELNLDKPWEDSITIQNYKNKFEDLFSTIVAQTEDMKKNAYRINAAANAFSANGLLTAELAPDSLLKSARIINNLIKKNADVIAAKAASEAAKDKAALASTDAYRIMHGEVGLAFKGNQIDSVVLNQDKGLIVAGKTGTTNVFFQLDNAEMGFFKGTPGTFNETNPAARPVPQLYYENGNLTLSGVIYAASGWFGDERGWIIGSGLTNSNSGKLVYKNSSGTNVTATISNDDLGGLLYSANGKAIFTSGSNSTNPRIILSKNGFPNITTNNGKSDALFLFDGTNLYISGTITSTAGNIGGWYIGSDYLGNASTLANSSIGFHTNTGDNIVLWAGNKTRASAPFRVTANGALTSTSGSIGGWIIDSNSIYYGTKGNSNKDNDITLMSSSTFTRTINMIQRSNLKFAIGQYFGVNNTGKLYAHDAIISGDITATSGTFTGAINARSGTIGQEKAPKITIGSSGNTSTSISWIYSGNKNTLNSDTLDGFYLGTNGLALGKGLFKVTDSGVLTAKRGTIGGWTIGESALYLNGATPGSGNLVLSKGTPSSTSIGGSSGSKTWMISASDKFGVTTAGDLYANSANITGAITATSGSFTGTIYAKDGRIGGTYSNNEWSGGWVIATGRLYSGDGQTRLELNSQATTTNNYAIWAGSNTASSASFNVTKAGKLTATGATINGNTSITANNVNITGTGNSSFTVNMTNFKVTDSGDVTVTGKIIAKDGSIAGWTIGNGYITTNTNRTSYNASSKGMTMTANGIGAWNDADNYFTLSATGGLTAKGANITGALTATTLSTGSRTTSSVGTNGTFIDKNGAIYVGKTNAFTVTPAGVVTATSGLIGGWTIGDNYIGTGTSRGSSVVGMSNYFLNNDDDVNKIVFWAGNPNTSEEKVSLKTSDIPFTVTRGGVLRASGAIITGAAEINTTASSYIGTKTARLQIKVPAANLTTPSSNPFKDLAIDSIGGDMQTNFYSSKPGDIRIVTQAGLDTFAEENGVIPSNISSRMWRRYAQYISKGSDIEIKSSNLTLNSFYLFMRLNEKNGALARVTISNTQTQNRTGPEKRILWIYPNGGGTETHDEKTWKVCKILYRNCEGDSLDPLELSDDLVIDDDIGALVPN